MVSFFLLDGTVATTRRGGGILALIVVIRSFTHPCQPMRRSSAEFDRKQSIAVRAAMGAIIYTSNTRKSYTVSSESRLAMKASSNFSLLPLREVSCIGDIFAAVLVPGQLLCGPPTLGPYKLE